VRSLLGRRDVRLLGAGQALSTFGDWALLIVLAIWVKDLTGSSAQAGLTFFLFAFGALTAPLGGLVADRVRRRPLMIATDCALGLSVLVLLFVHDRGDVWLIYLVALLYGIGGSVFAPARSALLRVMLPDELLADANGALQTMVQGMRLVAPLSGAGLYAAVGGGTVAVLDAATFAVSALLLGAMRVRESRPEPPEHHFLVEVSAGWRHVWRTIALRRMIFATAVALLVIGFGETLIFSVISQGIHRRPSFLGILDALQGAGSILGGLSAARMIRRLGDTRVVGLGLALFAVGDGLLVISSLSVVLVGSAIVGVGIALAVVAFTTAIQLRTPLQIQGRVSAAADLSLTLAQTISIAVGAALSTLVDYRMLLLVMAAVVLATGGYLMRRDAGLRARPSAFRATAR